jgi:glycosyltransferase involved in cell wall biosynthesis
MTLKRRLLLLIDRLEDGGAERQFCDLARGLARDGRFELTVGILARRRGVHDGAIESLAVPIVRFERSGRLRPRALRGLIRELRRGRHELIHAWKPLACDYAVMAGRLGRVPIVLSSIRNAQDHDWLHHLRTRIHARFADRLVSNSQAGFASRFRRMRPGFVVIRNGVDLARLEIDEGRRSRARAELPFAAGTRLVVMAASFTEKKDHATMLDAFAAVARARADVGLVLAGQGPTQAAARSRAAALGIAARVHFAGFVEQVEGLLAIADLSILLTDARRHREGISNSLVESMALGVPVVATAGGGTDEVVEDGVSGLLIPPRDAAAAERALLRLLDDRELRSRLIEGARTKVESAFGLDRFIGDHVKLYEEVLAGSPHGSSPR